MPLLVPTAPNPIDWANVPYELRAKYEHLVSAVVKSSEDAAELIKFFGGADVCPSKGILLLIPDTPAVYVWTDGLVPASEFQDLAVTTWVRTTERLSENGGELFDFDSLREQHGMMRRTDRPAAFSEALMARVKQHQANPVSDPGRDPMRDSYPRKTTSNYTRRRR